MAGVAGIAELLFVDGVAGVAGVVGLTGCAPDVITPIDIPPPPLPFLTMQMQIDALNPQKRYQNLTGLVFVWKEQ